MKRAIDSRPARYRMRRLTRREQRLTEHIKRLAQDVSDAFSERDRAITKTLKGYRDAIEAMGRR